MLKWGVPGGWGAAGSGMDGASSRPRKKMIS